MKSMDYNLDPHLNIDEIVNEVDKYGATYSRESRYSIPKTVIEAMCRGDHNAFREVYLHSIGPLTDFLAILLQSREEAEEVAQETFTYLWENISKIDSEKNFRGYLYTIAKTTAFKAMARRKKDAKFFDYQSHTYTQFDISPDEIVMSKELAMLINIYFSNMPPQRKRVFELSRNEGKSDEQIAKLLNISINTVRMHKRLAIKGFRDLITIALFLFFR